MSDVLVYDAVGRPVVRRESEAQRAARRVGALMFGAGGYSGARTDKTSLKDWQPGARSADADSVPDLETLRARSRDLIRNEPIASGAIDTTCLSAVGTELNVQASIDRDFLGLSDDEAEQFEETVERIWAVSKDQIDITGEQSFAAMSDLVLRTELGSGDVFAVRRFIERAGDLLGLKIQLIEADRIATPPEKSGDPNVVDGVERDSNGRAVRYHVRNRYPQDIAMLGLTAGIPYVEEWTSLPVRNRSGQRLVQHIFDRKRVDQTRGVPYLAPVVEPLKQLGRYKDSELLAAVVAAYFTVFVKTEGAVGLANETTDPSGDGTTATSGPEKKDLRLGPGMINDLDIGESIETANPGRPNAQFEPFVLAMLRQIGVGLQIPFEVLVKHFTSSYSAARAAMLDAWRWFRNRRAHLVGQWCQPTYEWVIAESVARGLVSAPGYFDSPLIRAAYHGAIWTGPPMGQIDPVKESDAAKARVHDLGIQSESEVTAEATGQDYEQVLRRRAADRKLRKRYGEPEPMAAAPKPGAGPEDPDPDDPDKKEEAEAA